MADVPAGGGEGFADGFTKKLGPLPVWAWAMLALGGILAYMYFTKSGFFSGSGNAASAGDTSGNPSLSDLLAALAANNNGTGSGATGGGTSGNGPPIYPPGTGPIDSGGSGYPGPAIVGPPNPTNVPPSTGLGWGITPVQRGASIMPAAAQIPVHSNTPAPVTWAPAASVAKGTRPGHL